MGEDDINKDKIKEAGAGQPQKPETPLTPDQQQSQTEKADATAAAAAGGPEAGLGELADANPKTTTDVVDRNVAESPEPKKYTVTDSNEDIAKDILRRNSAEEEFDLHEALSQLPIEKQVSVLGEAFALRDAGKKLDEMSSSEMQKMTNRQMRYAINFIDTEIAKLPDGSDKDRYKAEVVEWKEQLEKDKAPTAPEPEPTPAPVPEPAVVAPEPAPNNNPEPDDDTTTPEPIAQPDSEPATTTEPEEDLDDGEDPYGLTDLDANDLTEMSTQIQADLQRIAQVRSTRQSDESQRDLQQREDALLRKRDAVDAQKRTLKKNKKGSDEELEEKRRKIRAEATETARINNLPLAEHETELNKSKTELANLQEQLKAHYDLPLELRDPDAIRLLNEEITKAGAKTVSVEAAYTQKKAEDDVKKAEDEAKKQSEEYERQQLGVTGSADIQNRIDNLRAPLEELRGKIKAIEAEMANTTTTDERRAELLEERGKLLPDAVELQKKVGELDSALIKARQREADTLKPGEAGRFEPLKNINSAEWAKMSDDQRQRHLKELGKDKGNLTAAEFANIRNKIRNGDDLTVEESARFSKELGNRLIRDGRRGFDQKELAMLAATNPDIYNVALDRYINSKTAQDQLKELFPSSWQKILKFAQGKSWIIALLILMGGGAVVAAGKQFKMFNDSEKLF